jgi:hypothetical protein
MPTVQEIDSENIKRYAIIANCTVSNRRMDEDRPPTDPIILVRLDRYIRETPHLPTPDMAQMCRCLCPCMDASELLFCRYT